MLKQGYGRVIMTASGSFSGMVLYSCTDRAEYCLERAAYISAQIAIFASSGFLYAHRLLILVRVQWVLYDKDCLYSRTEYVYSQADCLYLRSDHLYISARTYSIYVQMGSICTETSTVCFVVCFGHVSFFVASIP
jgi:hypothetical protein